MITKELIDRFLRNECDAEQRQQVLEYLEEHPDAIEQWLPEEEFAAEQGAALEVVRGEAIYETIREKVSRKRSMIRRLKWGITAAASITLIIGMFAIMKLSKQAKTPQIAKEQADAGHVLITRLNNTKHIMHIELPDSSIVDLEAGAVLQYPENFNAYPDRVVYLEGTGLFEVKTDRARPFTVESDAIATTVLGTAFTVMAPEGSETIKVRLHSGKVVVRSSAKAAIKMKKDYYLLPGDELTYLKGSLTAEVVSDRKDDLTEVTTSGKKARASLQPDWYNFGGQPLSQVFEQLSSYYGVEINYRKGDISNRFFTGKFSTKDSVDVILKDIALLHGLDLKRVDGVYILRKNR